MNKDCMFPLPEKGTFTIYYRPNCPYSEQAIKLLRNLRLREFPNSPPCLMSYKTATGCPVPFRAWNALEIINACYNGNKDKFFTELQRKTYKSAKPTHRTFPLIFDPKGNFIGGFNELQRLIALNNASPSATLLVSPAKGSQYPYPYSGAYAPVP